MLWFYLVGKDKEGRRFLGVIESNGYETDEEAIKKAKQMCAEADRELVALALASRFPRMISSLYPADLENNEEALVSFVQIMHVF